VFEGQIKGQLVSRVPRGLGAETQGGKKQFVLDFGDIEYPLGAGGDFDVHFVLKSDEQIVKMGKEKGKMSVWGGDLSIKIGTLEVVPGEKQID
jgi:hypothetical protein